MRAIRIPRRARRVTGAACALLVCVGTVLAGCTAGPSVRPSVIAVDGGGSGSSPSPTTRPPRPTTPGKPPLPPLTKSKGSSIAWQPCDDQTRGRLDVDVPASLHFHCGQVFAVAKPPGNPLPVATHLSLLRAGDGPVPLVVVNDVGRTPGTLYAARLAAQLPASLLHRFSLIGVDRRGTGASHGLNCVPPPVRERIVGYDTSTTDLSGLLDLARKATQQCVLHLDNTRQAYTTWQTAADLERIRAALGVPRLNAIGHGEGGRVLATYATRYPAHTGRVVLDGVPDPSTDAEQRARTRADAAKQTFEAFAAHCVENGCPLGAHPRQAVTRLVDTLRTHPLVTRRAGEHGPQQVQVTGGTAVHAILRELPDPSHWGRLATALSDARNGDGSALAGLVAPLLGGSPRDGGRLDARMVTECNDEGLRLPPKKIMAASKSWQAQDPLFGGYFAQRLALCSPWPVPSQDHPKATAEDAPPILVLSTAHDPITPAVGTEHAAARMGTAVLVKWQGSGHGALTRSACATQAATAFLAKGDLPTNGTVCPP